MEEQVGKVVLKLDCYQGTDLYSDGPVEDELLEITPQNMRIRKRILNNSLRLKAASKNK